jgi:internalin A
MNQINRRKFKPVRIGILLLSGMFLMGQASECPWTEVVVFPDPVLDSTVRGAISKPEGDICISDLAGLESLVKTNPFFIIVDLTGLEHCTDLTSLTLFINELPDLAPLARLIKLEVLLLVGNSITDLSPLAGLTGLEHLELGVNYISDISPLTGLANLNELNLEGNEISDILPLVDNPGIDAGDEVYLSSNPLSIDSCTLYIPQLEARGVTVHHDCP